jgi:hypothetical protein
VAAATIFPLKAARPIRFEKLKRDFESVIEENVPLPAEVERKMPNSAFLPAPLLLVFLCPVRTGLSKIYRD